MALRDLENLKVRGGKSLSYQTGEMGDIVRVTVDYSLGGANYFRGGTDPRGLYVHVRPCKIEVIAGLRSESFGLLSGCGFFVEELKAKNDKRLMALGERLDAYAPALAKAFESGGKDAVKLLLTSAMEPKPPMHFFGDPSGVRWKCGEGSGANGTDEWKFVTCPKCTGVDLPKLRHFIGEEQLRTMINYSRGEEGPWFQEKLATVDALVTTMPKTYEQDGKGDEAIVWLHYFKGSMDWWITERDKEDDQIQAFGLAKMSHVELGYINIEEITKYGAELDLHWTPTTLKAVKEKISVLH